MRNPEPKEEEMENEPKIRIYVACLAAYNSGKLHGAWINAAQDAWGIYAEARAMLDLSPIADAEEWAIYDYEGFEGATINEYTPLDTIAEIAGFITRHGKLGAELIYYFGNLAEAREAIEERYRGMFASLADYVQDVTECCTLVPENLRCYIDWQAMARDAELSGDIFALETAFDEFHVFAGA